MFRNKRAFLIIVSAVVLWALPGSAKKWHLERDGALRAMSEKGEDGYLLAVARIKKLINAGETKSVIKALEELKKDFPEISGADLDAFMQAEVLFCEGKFVKAVRSFDKFLAEYPESGLYEAALEREFSIATAFLGGRKRPVLKVFKLRGYAEGERIMERISDRAGDAPIGKRAALAIVKSLEERKKFDGAYHKWSQISARWPSGRMGEVALLGMARCKHAAYRGTKYDASSLISAKSYYENFKLRYPKRAEEIGVDERLKQIDEQLAYKQFETGQYYERTGNKQSANLYYQMVLDNWPESTAARMVKEIQKSNGIRD